MPRLAVFTFLACFFQITYGQGPQLCTQVDRFTACITSARQRIDACSNAVVGTPTVTFYECQCTELTSIQSCYSICPEDPQLQMQLPNEQANAKAWCGQSSSMRSIEDAKKTSTSSTTIKPSATSQTQIVTGTPTRGSPPVVTNPVPGQPVGDNNVTQTSMNKPRATSPINFNIGRKTSADWSLGIFFVAIVVLL